MMKKSFFSINIVSICESNWLSPNQVCLLMWFKVSSGCLPFNMLISSIRFGWKISIIHLLSLFTLCLFSINIIISMWVKLAISKSSLSANVVQAIHLPVWPLHYVLWHQISVKGINNTLALPKIMKKKILTSTLIWESNLLSPNQVCLFIASQTLYLCLCWFSLSLGIFGFKLYILDGLMKNWLIWHIIFITLPSPSSSCLSPFQSPFSTLYS